MRYPKDGRNNSTNQSLKFILIISFASVMVVFFGVKYFLSPYVADSNSKKTDLIEKEASPETKADLTQSEKDSQDSVEFTFFDKLTKLKKYSPSKDEENTPSSSAFERTNQKKLNSKLPESIEIKEQKKSQPQNNFKFIIQMGSFKKKSRAESFVVMLNKKGYQASIESAEIAKNELWYRVFLKKGFADKKTAMKKIKEIKDKDKIKALLKVSDIG